MITNIRVLTFDSSPPFDLPRGIMPPLGALGALYLPPTQTEAGLPSTPKKKGRSPAPLGFRPLGFVLRLGYLPLSGSSPRGPRGASLLLFLLFFSSPLHLGRRVHLLLSLEVPYPLLPYPEVPRQAPFSAGPLLLSLVLLPSSVVHGQLRRV